MSRFKYDKQETQHTRAIRVSLGYIYEKEIERLKDPELSRAYSRFFSEFQIFEKKLMAKKKVIALENFFLTKDEDRV